MPSESANSPEVDITVLSSINGNNNPLTVKKQHTDNAATLFEGYQPPNTYKGNPVKKPYEKLLNCATYLFMQRKANGSLKLQQASFCRNRLCPMCQWRRSQKFHARVMKGLPSLLKAYPKTRFLFLTLTIRNCTVEELKFYIKLMNTAWNRLTNLKVFPGIGYIRGFEVTRQKNSDNCHPHIHALIAVNPGYFSNHYIKQSKWVELWKSALRVDYDPIVHIKEIKPNNPDDITDPNEAIANAPDGIEVQFKSLLSAVAEVAKYSVKPDYMQHISEELILQMEKDSKWLIGVYEALYKTKGVTLSGIFKEYFDKDDNDLINISDTDQVEDDRLVEDIEESLEEKPTDPEIVAFKYDRKFKDYVLVQ
jgi:plasmid rolling circle replication initiator protein Rep